MVEHGVVLPTRRTVLASEAAGDLAERTGREVVGLAERAETHGLDSVWVGDSVVAKPRHEPLTTLAAVAGVTEAVTLGTAVALPPLRDPVTTAQATATLDLLSGGRFAWGVGVGSVREEYHTLNRSWADRGPVLDETLDVVTELWSGGAVTYEGDHLAYEDVRLGFGPSRRPPIYVGSAVHPEKGIPRSIRQRVVTHGDGWFPVAGSPSAIALGRDQLRADLERAGRSRDIQVLRYQDVVIDGDRDAALEAARRFVEAYYPGYEPTDEALRARGVFGPPDAVRTEFSRFAAAGVDQFVTRFATRAQFEQLERFAEIVT